MKCDSLISVDIDSPYLIFDIFNLIKKKDTPEQRNIKKEYGIEYKSWSS